MKARRAFIFTADAVLAFYLITIILSILMLLTYNPRVYTDQPQQVASDTLLALSSIRLRDVQGNPQYPYTNSLLYIRHNSLAMWPMFERTFDHNVSVASVYPQSNSTWMKLEIGPHGLGITTQVHTTPIVYYGKIVMASENGTHVFDENTGAVLPRYQPIPADATPLLYNGRIFIGTLNKSIYAYDELSNIVWNSTLGGDVISSPIVHNGKLFLGVTNGSVAAVDLSSGNSIWNVSFSMPTQNITATPVIYNREVIVFSNDGFMGHLYALDEDTGMQLWSYSLSSASMNLFVDPSPAVANGVVYFTNEVSVDAVNATTGYELVGWPVTRFGLRFTSSPVFDNGIIYIGCANVNAPFRKGICAIDTTLSTPSCDQVDMGSAIYATPIVTNDSLIIGGYDGTVRIVNKFYLSHGGTLQTLWSYTTGGPIYSSPSLVNGRIYIGSNDGYLYAFGNCSLWDDNMSVIDSIAAFWSINRPDCAKALTKEFIDSAVPQNYGFEFVVKPPEGSGVDCSHGLYDCYYCNGSISKKWDSLYTNDCNQTKYQRFLIKDSRYISSISQKGSTTYYAQSPMEIELRLWN